MSIMLPTPLKISPLPFYAHPISEHMARLTPFEIGQIKAHADHELGATAIAAIVRKPDGACVSKQAVCDVLQKLKSHPWWRGERAGGSGRPRKTTVAVDKLVGDEVIRSRGHARVTVAYLKKKYQVLRPFSDHLVESRLHDAGLAYLRRRRKTLVAKKFKKDRHAFAARVQRMHIATLARWAYCDGTVFYLDRDDVDHESTTRAALGRFVWRRADRADAMYHDCVGPSGYNKAQGRPVRVWGLLSQGKLHVTVLPVGVAMNRWWYAWVIKKYFPMWLNGADQIVQDYERCLRCEEPLAELRQLGVTLVRGYPKCSQDLNAIENAWKLLRDRLYETQPHKMELRTQFVRRLKAAVRWLNIRRSGQLLKFSTNQKDRARDVLRMRGGRTTW